LTGGSGCGKIALPFCTDAGLRGGTQIGEETMNRQTMLQIWDHLRQLHGIGLRVIEAIPADRFDSHPVPNMRTPKELVVHVYDVSIRGIPEGIIRGEVLDTESQEKQIAAGLKSKDQVMAFARECWTAGDRAVAAITDAQLAAEVKTPWGMNFPGFVGLNIIHDEYLHHRGQLYAFARALGAEPPMMWDFAHNEPAYQPKSHAQA
jgi:uncharacterized damage-inducible protein DinB